MAVNTVTMRNRLATAYGTEGDYAALFTTALGGTAPNNTPGTEVTGGSPAYARKLISWGTATGGAITGTVIFDVPSGVTVTSAGVYDAITAGTFLDGGALSAPQAFSSQGTYTLTLTYTQS